MATENRYASNVLRHDNHTAPASLTERTFTEPVNSILIFNTDAADAAEVSFDGANTFTIPAQASLQLDVSRIKSYWTKATAGSPALKVLLGSER